MQIIAFPTACNVCITALIIYFIQSFSPFFIPSSCTYSAFLCVVIDQQDGSRGVSTPQPPVAAVKRHASCLIYFICSNCCDIWR
jgi:hypothetical protein